MSAPPAYFFFFILIITSLASWEYFAIALASEDSGLKALGAGLSVAAPLGMYLLGPEIFLWFVPLIVFVVFLYLLFYHKDIHSAAGLAGKTVLGVIYIGIFLSYIIGIRQIEYGGWQIIFLFSIIWANDTFAYFVGKSLGRIKLAPAISPNKTVEGSIAGLIGGLAAALVFNSFLFKKLDLINAVLLALVLGILCQLGDLFESMLKRSAGVKDSGSIIPGHGGVLDRIDSAIIPLPFFYYYLVWSL